MSQKLYETCIKVARQGFNLRGGPLAKWRYPLAKALYKKRIIAGPETLRPRSYWPNWNYESEIYAFSKRLNENFDETLLQQAFIQPSYSKSEAEHLKILGFDETTEKIEIKNNFELAYEGEKICRSYVQALLNFWYPKFPIQGVDSVTDYLLSNQVLVHVGKNIGICDLIKSEHFPVPDDEIRSTMFSIIAALNKSSGMINAHLFINDFIVTQLIGKDINEIWNVMNPMGLLVEELKKSGEKSLPTPRLIWSTGVNLPTSVYMVGLYLDKKFLSKGSGETIDIAEEMAARNALRRIYNTGEEAAPLPFGEKARKYSEAISKLCHFPSNPVVSTGAKAAAF